MNNTTRKELKTEYKERRVIGGIYAVRNTVNGKLLLGAVTDLRVCVNRFEFALKTGSCVDPKLQKDWDAQSGVGFVFEVLEELQKGETQTEDQYKADIKLLREMWLEKLDPEALY